MRDALKVIEDAGLSKNVYELASKSLVQLFCVLGFLLKQVCALFG